MFTTKTTRSQYLTEPMLSSSKKIPIKLKSTSSEKSCDKKEEPAPSTLPSGLYYVPNFITPEESKTFLLELAQNKNWVGVTSSQKSRKVIHYGYIYSYTGGPLQATDPIPDLYQSLWGRIPHNPQFFGSPFFEKGLPEFDQLIINEYVPGQGIAAHTDHTTKFGPVIACITLGSGVEIEFTRPGHESFKIYTEPNSLYIMSGDSRYLWKHAIIQRKSDTVDGKIHHRGTRISLTFREAQV